MSRYFQRRAACDSWASIPRSRFWFASFRVSQSVFELERYFEGIEIVRSGLLGLPMVIEFFVRVNALLPMFSWIDALEGRSAIN